MRACAYVSAVLSLHACLLFLLYEFLLFCVSEFYGVLCYCVCMFVGVYVFSLLVSVPGDWPFMDLLGGHHGWSGACSVELPRHGS